MTAPAPAQGATPGGGSRATSLLRNALRLVGPVLLAVVLFRMKDREAVLNTLRSALGWKLALAILLNILSIHLKVWRWSVLLSARGISFPMKRAWSAFLASSYVGMLTPGRVGDVLRVQYLRYDKGVTYAEGVASVVMDRICDLYVLAAMVGLAIVRFRTVVAGQLAQITWVTLVLIVLGPLLFLIPGIAEAVASRLYSKLVRGPDAESGFALFLRALRETVNRKLWGALAITLLAFALNFFQAWLLAGALGLAISFYDVGCLLAIASLLGLLPISVSGLGVRELIYALVFPVLGYTAADGVAFGLLVFAVLYLFVVLLGFIGWQLAPPPIGLPPRGEGVPVGGTGTRTG